MKKNALAAIPSNKPNLDKVYADRLVELIQEGMGLRSPDKHGSGRFPSRSTSFQYSSTFGWATSALAFVENIFGNVSNPYTIQISKQLDSLHSFTPTAYVTATSIGKVLEQLHSAISEGFIASLQNRYQAETFDDFLAHAEEYLNKNRKMESGVIAGVVFEDTIKKICRKHDIEGDSLEQLINALKANNIIQKTMASRCKTAAAVRGTATHANWDDLDIGSVRDTVSLTRELLSSFLE